MSQPNRSFVFNVAQLGELSTARTRQALGLANEAQRAFHFKMDSRKFPLDRQRYGFPNHGFDLDSAVCDLVSEHELPKPFVFISSEPYGEQESRTRRGAFIFSNHHAGIDSTVSIVSTYAWAHLPGSRPLESYILYNLATAALARSANLYFHEKGRDCPFFIGKSTKAEDIDYSFKGNGLCEFCEHILERKQRRSEVSLEMIAAAKKLFNLAFGKRICFMAMPFCEHFDPVLKLIRRTLEARDWNVVRADDIAKPRRIRDAILQATFMSDLMVADITGGNPNVMYEVGVAHALGCDVIFLTQDQSPPFDVNDEKTLFYEPTKSGLAKLGEDFRQLVPIRTS